MIWINARQLKCDITPQAMICEKAKALYEDLKKSTPGPSSSAQQEEEEFEDSRGWFQKFVKRSGIHSVIMLGEDASADTKEAEKFAVEFPKLV